MQTAKEATQQTVLGIGAQVQYNGTICRICKVNDDGSYALRPVNSAVGNWLAAHVAVSEFKPISAGHSAADIDEFLSDTPKPRKYDTPKTVKPDAPALEIIKKEAIKREEVLNEPLSEGESSEFSACENVIERGLKSFVEVGQALQQIREGRLYRHDFKTFEEYCDQRWDMTRRFANYQIAAAQVVQNLGTIVPKPATESQARPLSSLPDPESQRAAWQLAQAKAGDDKITAADVEVAVQEVKSGAQALTPYTPPVYDPEIATVLDAIGAIPPAPITQLSKSTFTDGVPKALQSSESNEWYTPHEYVEAARALMGGIDLDPASCEFANETVQAAAFYSLQDNGLAQDWQGRIWLNPPYGRDEENESNQGVWSGRLIRAYESGTVTEAVLLVNAVTDRIWFAPFWNYAICFVKQRIKFYNGDPEHKPAPTHGSVLVYFGVNLEGFIREFSPLGQIVVARGRLSEAIHA